MKPRINQSILLFLTLIFPFALSAQTNIAKGKTARQFPDNTTFGRATNAVDGNTSGKWMAEDLTITATGEGDNPWWSVDLGAAYDISEIRIWNRTDACCWNRLQNFYVMVSEEPITANSTTKQQYVPGPLKFNSADESSMPLQNNARGRYIRIFISGKKILSLAEVEVFGKPVETNSPTNVAKGKTARQSSNWYYNGDGTAMKAVDGNASGTWQYGDGNTISHTKEQNDPWWEVDLGTAYDISEIKIYNRIGNWTWNRLQNFYVMVSENPIAQEPRNCWFAFMTQFWFNNMQSGGPNRNCWIDLEGFDKAEKEYLGTIFNPSNTWLPPRWLRDR